MISLGAAIESLVPAAQYEGYHGNVEVTPATYAALVIQWEDARPIPAYDDVVDERDAMLAAQESEETEMTNLKDKMTTMINNTSYGDVETIIEDRFSDHTAQQRSFLKNLTYVVLHYGKRQV